MKYLYSKSDTNLTWTLMSLIIVLTISTALVHAQSDPSLLTGIEIIKKMNEALKSHSSLSEDMEIIDGSGRSVFAHDVRRFNPDGTEDRRLDLYDAKPGSSDPGKISMTQITNSSGFG